MAAAADARAALSRSRVVTRGLVHAAQVAVLVVAALALLLHALAESTWAASAAPCIHRLAAFFLVPQRLCFLAVNIVVFLIVKVFPGDAASLSPSSFADPSGSPATSSDANGDALQQHPFLAFLEVEDPPQQAPAPITEAEPAGSGEQAPAPPPLEEEAPVFEDKQAVHVKTVRAQPPRRTKSDKTRGGGDAAAAEGRTSAASPELQRAKSDNCKRRQERRSAATAASAATTAATAPVELATDDAEAFRQSVEAFIAKQQTWFHREESLILARASSAANAAGDRRRCCGGREVSA